MASVRPCTAMCVLDGVIVLVSFYSESGLLRLNDAAGRCYRETRWDGSWAGLMASLKAFDADRSRSDLGDLLHGFPACARSSPRTSAPDTARLLVAAANGRLPLSGDGTADDPDRSQAGAARLMDD